jgi:hypothetical protein
MFSKRPLPHDRLNEPPAQRLRTNMADLFLQNDVSGLRTHSLFQDAHDCDLPGFQRLANVGTHPQNIARGIRRALLKGTQWPKLYYARVRVWDKRQQRESTAWLPFLLPHEILASIGKVNDATDLLDTSHLCADSLRNLNHAKSQLGENDIVGMGLWGDGCPCNWDRTESIEVFSLNFPGITAWSNLRLPLAVISKKFVVTGHTFDDILDVIAWSFRACAVGKYPSQRHDESAFTQLDSKRRKLAGKSLPVKAALCEIRGDWMFLKETFRLPAWNEKAGCCFKCKIIPSEIKQCGEDAAWRKNRLDHWGILQRMLEQGKEVSPLFSAPCFRVDLFQIDWLHCADHGITADFLGNLFYFILVKFEGDSRRARCQNLWLRLQSWYDLHGVTDRLGELKVTMLKQPKTPPKLRSKAAEARALVPFAKYIANAMLSDTDVVEHCAKQAAVFLDSCYACLSASQFHQAVLADSCRKFCLLYCSLSNHTSDALAWRVKPKMHMFQELCEMGEGTLPSLCWTYRDEDFGGSIAKYSRSRGGKNSPLSRGRNVLNAFLAKNKVPVL